MQVSPDSRTAEKHLFSCCDLYSQALRLSPKVYPLSGCFSAPQEETLLPGDYMDDNVLLP